MLTLDKGYNEMSKFPNRILGMPVEMQNILLRYTRTQEGWAPGRYDQGILDVGMTQEDHWKLVKT